MPDLSPKSTLFVLGAGVDVGLGLPTMQELLRELASFSSGDGKRIDKLIRNCAKGLRLNLRGRVARQGERLGELLLGSHAHLLDPITSVLERYVENAESEQVDAISALLEVVQKLQTIADANQIDDETCEKLSELAGEPHAAGGGEHIIEPHGVSLTPVLRQTMRNVFTGALAGTIELSAEERKALNEIVSLVSNFEEMLGDVFAGFFTKNVGKQKQYFYLSWLLWAYLTAKQADAVSHGGDRGFYDVLGELGNYNIITFNYTDFYEGAEDKSRVCYFHGSCSDYIRFDTKELVSDDDRLRGLSSIEDIEAAMEAVLEDNAPYWDTQPPRIVVPGIVPPLAVKPIICNEYLKRWSEALDRLAAAKRVIIVGYSFNVADEHFNDGLRKRQEGCQVVLVDPAGDSVLGRLARVLNKDPGSFTKAQEAGLETWRSGRVKVVKARAEEVDVARLEKIVGE